MKTWSRLKVMGVEIMERRERGQTRTCMNDPRIWATVWKLTVGGEMGGEGQRGKS